MIVSFLSDYGAGDEYAGVVVGVIASLCSEARVIELGHGVPPQDVRTGARRLARALPYLPAGVHLAVVDPGVGGPRQAVALRTAEDGRLLVGPDNGLLADAADRFGGVAEAVEISASPWRLEPVSATFHGRDLFAPVAARLACGAPLSAAGAPLDPAGLVRLPELRPRRDGDAVIFHVVELDGFGNVMLDGTLADAPASARLRAAPLDRPTTPGAPGPREAPARRSRATGAASRDALACGGAPGMPLHRGRTFADVATGELVLYEDSGGSPALAVNGGSAAAALGVRGGDGLRLEPA